MSSDNQNGWNEYSRLVLKRVGKLFLMVLKILRDELQSVKQEIAKNAGKRKTKVDEIKFWKDKS